MSHQHPAPRAAGVRSTRDECVVYFLNDCDEVITLQLREKREPSETKAKGTKAGNEVETGTGLGCRENPPRLGEGLKRCREGNKEGGGGGGWRVCGGAIREDEDAQRDRRDKAKSQGLRKPRWNRGIEKQSEITAQKTKPRSEKQDCSETSSEKMQRKVLAAGETDEV